MLTFLGWFIAILLGAAFLFALICIPHNVRVRRVRRVYKSLPAEVRDRVLEVIDAAPPNA